MRRNEVKRYIEDLEAQDKQGMLTRDDQIDLWFKRMMFDLTATVEDKSVQPLAEDNYRIDYLETVPPRPVNVALPTDWVINPAFITAPEVRWNTREYAAAAPLPPLRRHETYTFEDFNTHSGNGEWDGVDIRVVDDFVDVNDQRYITIEYGSN
jgi:hypothetical protein